MSEQFNSKRVFFESGEQANFLLLAKENLNVTWPKFANILEVHTRVLNDWKREKYSMPLSAVLKIQEVTGINPPNTIRTEDRFWYTSKGGKISGPLVYEKYGQIGGDSTYRKSQWEKWWEESNHKNNLGAFAEQKDIKIPELSDDLAELAGIILGNGSLTKRQLKITLDSKTDKDYIPYVSNLIEELFGIIPTVRKKISARAVDIIVSRTKIIIFWERLGLLSGNKTKRQAEIPLWILKSSSFKIACVRGLMDTDGSIFNECHSIKQKLYCYPRISFVNRCQPLLEDVYKILCEADFAAKIRGKRAVTLEKREDVIRYFNEVGTHNQKHAARFKEFCSQ